MATRGERIRFWLPVAVLAALAVYSSQKLIRAHVDPQVKGLNYEFTRPQPARRGGIFDVRGVPLAQSVPVWDYHLDPVALTNHTVRVGKGQVRTRRAILKTIARALRMDFKKVLALADEPKKRYQPLGRSSDAHAHEILANNKVVSGVIIETLHTRQYMQKKRLSHVIGAINVDGGLAGIELKYNAALTGIPGEICGMKDAHGNELRERRKVTVDPVPGCDVYLTVDNTIQYEVETALADGVREFGSGAGWCVVLDARSAAVLAMASVPDFNPLDYGSTSDRAKVNRVTNFTYEPGSVMKVITAASAFDCGFVGPDRLYSTERYDTRYYKLPGDGSHKWEPTMTVRDAVAHSSNIVIGKLAYDMGPKRLYKYMRAFGFGQKTGVELPGEEIGLLPDPNRRMWDKASWSRAGIGQFVSVTAMQLASAYQAIANDGVRMKPHIVSRILSSTGEEQYRHVDEPLGKPVSAEAARTIRNVMLGVATPNGTARRAAVKGYSVAGKTGTAQKVIGRTYAPGLYRASFIGIVPASAPRLVILVTLDFDEKRKFHQGGNSSAVVFRRIAKAALRYLMVPPDKPEELADEEDGAEDETETMMDERAQNADVNWNE